MLCYAWPLPVLSHHLTKRTAEHAVYLQYMEMAQVSSLKWDSALACEVAEGWKDRREEMSLLCQLTWLSLTWDMTTPKSAFWQAGWSSVPCKMASALPAEQSHYLSLSPWHDHGWSVPWKAFLLEVGVQVSLEEKQQLHGVYLKRIKSGKGFFSVFFLFFCISRRLIL